MQESKWIQKTIITGALVTAGIVIYLISLHVSRMGETRVEVSVLPEYSTLTINGKNHEPGNIYLEPGSYTFVAKAAGFKDDSQTVEVGEDPEIVELLPEPDTEDAKRLLETDLELQRAREEVGGRRANRLGEERAEETPLVTLLPVTQVTGPFKIDYGPSDKQDNGIVLYVSLSSPKGRANALKWIRDHGSDPTDLEIYYKDFVNPLTGMGQ